MQLHLTAKGLDITPDVEATLTRHLDRLRPRLRHFAPDLVHLDLALRRHPRKQEYSGSIRLSVAGTLLPSRLNRAGTLEGLIKAAFDDLEEQLSRHKARLRRDHAHERRRASLPQETIGGWERALLEERELLDRTVAGDRDAFDRLVEEDLPSVRRRMLEALIERRQDPRPEIVEQILGDVLTVAARQVARKPPRWSMNGWLTWLARKEIRRRVNAMPVTRTAQIRS